MKPIAQSNPERVALHVLGGDPAVYHKFSEEYFEVSVPRIIIDEIYDFKPLTPEMVTSLNPQTDLDAIATDLDEIGYPRVT